MPVSVPSSFNNPFDERTRQILASVDQRARINDAFDRYTQGAPEALRAWKGDHNIYQWWQFSTDCPELRQMAFDTLSIPATSTELERVFSQAKRILTAERSRLKHDDIESASSFEALILLRQWHQQQLYTINESIAGNAIRANQEA